MSTIRRILVTGSSGTIGTALCQHLLEKKFEIIGVDWLANKWDPQLDTRTIRADLRDPLAWEKIPPDVDAIVHLAANARVYDLTVEPDGARDNVLTLYNALEFCRKHRIRRFLFASSRETYGNNSAKKNKEENVAIERSESPYAASKLAGEAFVHAYSHCYGIHHVIFRFSNVYGRFDDSIRVVPLFIRQARENKTITVFGRDKAYDMTFIDDAIDGIQRAIERFDRVQNNTFNIATGKATRLRDVATWIKDELESKSKIVFAPMRQGEIRFHRADISKARNQLGFSPKIPARKGIQKAVAWYQQHRPE